MLKINQRGRTAWINKATSSAWTSAEKKSRGGGKMCSKDICEGAKRPSTEKKIGGGGQMCWKDIYEGAKQPSRGGGWLFRISPLYAMLCPLNIFDSSSHMFHFQLYIKRNEFLKIATVNIFSLSTDFHTFEIVVSLLFKNFCLNLRKKKKNRWIVVLQGLLGSIMPIWKCRLLLSCDLNERQTRRAQIKSSVSAQAPAYGR